MAELKQCEFFLLRYVPDAVKNEFVNIGVVLMGGPGDRAHVRLATDWSRVRCLDPAADLEMLEALAADMRSQLAAPGNARKEFLRCVEESFSNLVQLSATQACLAEDAQVEADRLAEIYLKGSRREGRDSGGRIRIVRRMREAFEEAGAWSLMWQKISVARYTKKGDPLKLDCGYKPNGVVRLYHGVALAREADGAKALALASNELRAGMEREFDAKVNLTAVVDTKDRSDELVDFSLATLEQNAIQVAGLNELGALAELARKELRV